MAISTLRTMSLNDAYQVARLISSHQSGNSSSRGEALINSEITKMLGLPGIVAVVAVQQYSSMTGAAMLTEVDTPSGAALEARVLVADDEATYLKMFEHMVTQARTRGFDAIIIRVPTDDRSLTRALERSGARRLSHGSWSEFTFDTTQRSLNRAPVELGV